nr:Gag-Pol polyprotein [Tanacetum cinerariifolium]
TSREEKHVPNTVSASNKTKPITVSQPSVITKKDVNSDLSGLSSTGVDNTKTKRPQPRSNTKHDRVPFASKSSRSKNKEAEVEEHHRNLMLSKNNKHISSACNNTQIDSQDVISKVVCATCTKCLISVNHDKCLRNYVDGKNSCGKKQKAKVSFKENQMKYQPKVTKPKKVEHHKSLAIPKLKKSRLLVRWSPTGKLFDNEGKIVDYRESKSQFDCSNGDNACTSNYLEPKIKRFPNSASLLDRLFRFVYGLLKFKYHNEHICPSCEQGKSKRASHPPKLVPNSRQRLHLLHMDLCGPMRIASINGKRYILVIVDYYSRYTWVHFLRSKDEAPEDVDELNPNAMVDGNTFVNLFATLSTNAAASSSSQNVDPSNMHTFYQPYPHEFQWTKDHPLEQVIGEPSRPILTRNQLRSDGDMCMYALTVSIMKPKNVKEAITDPAWIDSMQEELLQFKRLD